MINLNNRAPPLTDLVTVIPQKWLPTELDEVIIYESTSELTMLVSLEFKDIGPDSRVDGGRNKLEDFRVKLNSFKDMIIEDDKELAVQTVEREHEEAGKEFPQSSREEIEKGPWAWPVIKIMKLKESGTEVPI